MSFTIDFDSIAVGNRESGRRERAEFERIVAKLRNEAHVRKAFEAHTGVPVDVATPAGIEAFGRLLNSMGERYAAQDATEAGMYADIAALLDGDVQRVTASIAPRTDGQGLIYAGKVNTLFGDPEAGKSLVATAMAVTVLQDGGKVLWIDLDHNGASETVSRFLAFGAPVDALRDPDRFRFLDNPEDSEAVLRAVEGAGVWLPTLAVVDSMGELIPLFGGNSDNADDFTNINRQVNARLAEQGAAVIAIDHMAKGEGSRSYGAGGTMAKKRAANGAYYRVENKKAFAPGQGGKSVLRIVKDRPGDIRANSPRASSGAPEAAAFDLATDGTFRFWAPSDSPATRTTPVGDARFADMEKMDKITVTAVKARFGIGTDAARALIKAFEDRAPF